jgi:hypothetical protein
MASDTHQIPTLLLFFTALALSMWRWPQGDRWHVVLTTLAAILWASVWVLEPRTRTFGYGLIVGNFLSIALARPFRLRAANR